MVADVLDLAGRRPDLSSAQQSELYLTGRSWLAMQLAPGIEPTTEVVFAWIDEFIPAEATRPDGDPSGPKTRDASDPNAGVAQSPFDPDSLAMAEPLRLLAGRRPDLSEARRRELYSAARSRLTRRVRGRIAQPSRSAIFAWIDAAVPIRTPVRSVLDPANQTSPAASTVPHGTSAPSPGLSPQSTETLPLRRSRKRARALPEDRAIRQSLDGQEPSDPYTADMLARAAGRGSRDVTEPPDPAVAARPRRARGLADPRAAFNDALVEAVYVREGRLSKTAIATRMGIDRKTLRKYIDDGLIPQPPWESLAADLSGTSRPQ